MLRLQIKNQKIRLFNETDSTFSYVEVPAFTLVLEHSLVSISKWESKFHKPLLSTESKTDEEVEYYVRCMCITQNVPEIVFTYGLDAEISAQISEYMEDEMTATKIINEDIYVDEPGTKTKKVIHTSEIIYSWMVAYNIPKDCEKWHINRLLTLIKVCELNNQPERKIDQRKLAARNAKLNAARRARLKSGG